MVSHRRSWSPRLSLLKPIIRNPKKNNSMDGMYAKYRLKARSGPTLEPSALWTRMPSSRLPTVVEKDGG